MKTVFLFLRQGISNRNLLRTDFSGPSRKIRGAHSPHFTPSATIVGCFAKNSKRPMCVEKMAAQAVGFLEKRLKNLKDYVWVSRGLTQAIRVRRLAQRGKWGLAWRDVVGRFARQLGGTEERINQWEMAIYRTPAAVAQLYCRYQPDLVVFTRLFGTNLHVIKEAKFNKIPVLCLVESWDNFISKGPLSVIPDSIAGGSRI